MFHEFLSKHQFLCYVSLLTQIKHCTGLFENVTRSIRESFTEVVIVSK